MVAYLIAQIDVTDPKAYEAYRPLAAAAIERHGGKYVVRGGKTEALEGAPPPRVIVLEFPTMEAARKFYHSPDYTAARKVREAASTGQIFLVEGM
jgi:uncharacterized protein (DUF1330 family)